MPVVIPGVVVLFPLVTRTDIQDLFPGQPRMPGGTCQRIGWTGIHAPHAAAAEIPLGSQQALHPGHLRLGGLPHRQPVEPVPVQDQSGEESEHGQSPVAAQE